jgi:DNA-binding response OmpR family regulator
MQERCIVDGKVLVISKDIRLMEFLDSSLPYRSYQVLTDPAEEDVTSILGEIMPNLVILDIMMPRMKGIELCFNIRRHSQVPIIMLSTWKTRIGEVRGLDISSETCLTEPFGQTRFRELCEEAILRDSRCMLDNATRLSLLLDTTRPLELTGQCHCQGTVQMN